MENGIVDLISFDYGFAWRHWAVWYFLLVGAASGAALIAFFAAWRDENAPQVRPALFAAAACGFTAPFPLLADLHQPSRFMNFYLGAATDSIMWWGAWFLPAFVAGLAVLVLLYSPLGQRFHTYRRYVWYWTAAFALAVLAYTAGEMTVVTARPAWHEAWFPVMLTLSAVVSGSGVIAIVAATRGENPGIALRLLAVGSMLFVVGILGWIASGWGDTVGNGGAFVELAVKDNPVGLLIVMTGVCGLGGAVLAFAGTRAAALSALAGVLAVLGALVFRWELFMGAQAQPKTEAGFQSYSLLANSDALTGLLGTVGLLAVILVFLTFFLVHEDEGSEGRRTSHTAL